MELGKRVFFYRNKKQLTQSELSKGICSTTYLSKIENEKINPSDEILELLCERLGITVVQIQQDPDQLLSEHILQWYNHIKINDIKKMHEDYKELRKKVGSIDLSVKALFKLFEFRYLIQTKQTNKIDKEKLNQYKDLISILEYQYKYYYYKFLGIYYYINNQFRRSLEQFQQSKKILEELEMEDPDLFYQLSLVTSRLNKSPLSLIYAYKALEGFQKKFNFQRCLECNLLLGINLNDMDNPEEALSLMKNVIENNNEKKVPQDFKSKILHNIGYSYFLLEDFDQAKSYFRRSLVLKKNTSQQLNSFYMITLLMILTKEKNVIKIYQHIESGIKLSRSEKNKVYEIKFFLLKYKMKDKEVSKEYINYLERCVVPYFESKEDKEFTSELLTEIAYYYQSIYQYKRASFYFEKLLTLRTF
jgi:HTH-type transcriptional regulator, quorum sensing regulator NprR